MKAMAKLGVMVIINGAGPEKLAKDNGLVLGNEKPRSWFNFKLTTMGFCGFYPLKPYWS